MAPRSNPLRVGSAHPPGVLNIAHRGSRAFAPENTLAAFEKARTLFGCPMFELDVQRTRDGELVVHHDDQLTRCTDVAARFPGRAPWFVSDFTLDELLTLDAGTWYVEQLSLPADSRQPFLRTLTDQEQERFVSARDREVFASGEIRLPMLRETLDLARRLGMLVNIELKALPRMHPGLAGAVVDLVRSSGMEPDVLISSFDRELLAEVRGMTDVVATGVLTSDRLARPGECLQLLDADAYHPSCYGPSESTGFGPLSGQFDPRDIQSVRDCGRAVNVWTCNDPDQIRQLIAAGATGVITDYPNRVRDVLAGSAGA